MKGNIRRRLKALALDVTNEGEVNAAVEQAVARFGRVDVLVNNAGYGVAGAIEEVSEAEFMPMFETNVFGLLRVTRAFLPQLRKQRSGHILNLSSIGGLVASPGMGYYNATKFAVEGLSEALAAELAPLGIKVTIVEPGPFRTDFLGRSGVIAEKRIPDYDTTAANMRRYFAENDGKQPGDPVRAVHAMMQVVDSPEPPLRLLLGASALQRLRTKIGGWEKEIATWEQVTVGRGFSKGSVNLFLQRADDFGVQALIQTGAIADKEGNEHGIRNYWTWQDGLQHGGAVAACWS